MSITTELPINASIEHGVSTPLTRSDIIHRDTLGSYDLANIVLAMLYPRDLTVYFPIGYQA